MSRICPECGEEKYGFMSSGVCTDCYEKIETKRILDKASECDKASFFKDWSSKDRTTAFFEAFGRYVREPNERDIKTIMSLWLWACHADHALVKSIGYTFKWAKMDLRTEYHKWIRKKV